MKEIDVIEGRVVNIGFPCTPSVWDGNLKKRRISRIKMSCGGGMGGSTWFEYVELVDVDKVDFGKLLIVTRIDGTAIAINPKYIVRIENFVLIEGYYVTQNTWKGGGRQKIQCLVEDGACVNRVDEYVRYG